MYSRYAVYYVPNGAWGDFGARFLGWDSRTGEELETTSPELTERPRKYGFHATIKPPFRLAGGRDQLALSEAVSQLCRDFVPFRLPSLRLSQIGRFYALTAPEEQGELSAIADATVRGLDDFRAPLTEGELARRRQSRLSPAQDALLEQWGYPYVMEEFRFHMTLTGPVKEPEAVTALLQERLRAVWSEPLWVDSLSLLGEAEDGRFHQISRFAFGG